MNYSYADYYNSKYTITSTNINWNSGGWDSGYRDLEAEIKAEKIKACESLMFMEPI